MILDENLVIIHSYLCADGYVVKNPLSQKHKYYRMGLRNQNYILLKDFQNRFEKYFGVKPWIKEGQRCEKGSKEIYNFLTNKFGSFYSYKWKMPKLNMNFSRLWLRTFFDCEGWVFCKTHQNRHIGLDSVNKEGLRSIVVALDKFGIKTIWKENRKRRMFRIFIFGKENLKLFQEEINFLHPGKKQKLIGALDDYVDYFWKFPLEKNQCELFVRSILSEKLRVRRKKYLRIVSKERINLEKLNGFMKEFYEVEGILYERVNGFGTKYFELNINRRDYVQKLIDESIIPNIFKL